MRTAGAFTARCGGGERRAGQVEIKIISDGLTCGEVFGALARVTRTVGRKVNPTLYTAAEFAKRAREFAPGVLAVDAGSRTVVRRFRLPGGGSPHDVVFDPD